MSKTMHEINKIHDSLGIHWTQPIPPSEWGAWNDESVDALGADEAPDWWLDRLDAKDKAEVD